MISGIRSLSATYEQFVIGWIGDIESPNTNSGTSLCWKQIPTPHYMTSSSPSFFAPARALTRQFNVPPAGECVKIPSTVLSEEDTTALEEEIANFKSEDEDAKITTTYVPVLLDDKVAHGHYDGYCKQSEFLIVTSTIILRTLI
jgi:trehalose 6-phosphate synthase/phosphatase